MTLRNAYLLRYGRSVAYYEYAAQRQQLVERASRLDRARWHQMRREITAAQHEQVTRFPSAIGARPILLRSRIAGLLLLRRDFCPHGKKEGQPYPVRGCPSQTTGESYSPPPPPPATPSTLTVSPTLFSMASSSASEP
jgi:hypothetical protein